LNSNIFPHQILVQASLFNKAARPLKVGQERGARLLLGVVFATSVGFLGGCTFLPSGGPSGSQVKHEGGVSRTTETGHFKLVKIDGEVVDTLKKCEVNSSASGLSSLAAPVSNNPRRERIYSVTGINMPTPLRQTIAVGDSINITIYAAGGSLFGTLTPGGLPTVPGTVLPPQTVDESGEITVPYAGRILVKGRTPFQVEAEIVERLKAKAIDPQAIVTIGTRNGGNLVTVTGDVKTPLMVPIAFGGTRLLDAITAAGGPNGNSYETIVTVIRDGKTGTDLLASIMSSWQRNISLQAGDTVILRRRAWNFLSFGASGQNNGIYPFDGEELSLAEAIAKTGGLADGRANPATVFLFRWEKPSVLRKLGYTVSKSTEPVPVVYQLDLHSAKGFFLAQGFSVRNKDVVYFANAGSVGFMKFLNLVNAITAPARSGLSTAAGVDNLGL